jgi:hypothetical protein
MCRTALRADRPRQQSLRRQPPRSTMLPMAKEDDLAEVVQRERLLLDPALRASSKRVRELLHPQFIEFGASGRVWDRTRIIAAMGADSAVSGEGIDFAPVALADDVVLLTHRITGPAGSLQSSVWVRTPSGWLLRFLLTAATVRAMSDPRSDSRSASSVKPRGLGRCTRYVLANRWELVGAFVAVLFWMNYATARASRAGVGSRTVSGVTLGFVFVLVITSARRVILLRPTSSSRDVGAGLFGGLLTLNLYIGGFAGLYLSFGGGGSDFLAGPNASDNLGRLDAVYFTLTTFTTTGYGDWHPASEGARAVVVAQLVSGFVVVSVLLALVLSSVMAHVQRTATPESKSPVVADQNRPG